MNREEKDNRRLTLEVFIQELRDAMGSIRLHVEEDKRFSAEVLNECDEFFGEVYAYADTLEELNNI
jgi:hypothetical protein